MGPRTISRHALRGTRLAVPALDEAIQRQREVLKRALTGYGSNAGPNGLHDLRIALRRSAALGRLLHGYPGPKDGRQVWKLADELRRQLSPARQQEVSLELARILARKDEELFRLVAAPLSSGRGARRHPGIADVQRAGEEVLTAMDFWREAVQDRAQGRAADRGLRRAIGRRARKEAKEILTIGVPNRKTLHPQRIACKKLRYELEILRDIVPGVERVVRASRRVQEALGEAHDWDCVVRDLSKAAGTLRPEEKKRVMELVTRAKSLRQRISRRARKVTADFLPLVETLAQLLRPAAQRASGASDDAPRP